MKMWKLSHTDACDCGRDIKDSTKIIINSTHSIEEEERLFGKMNVHYRPVARISKGGVHFWPDPKLSSWGSGGR